MGADGRQFQPRRRIPPFSRIEYTVPRLTAAQPEKLAGAQKDLSRFIRVVLPKGHDPMDYVEELRSWPCLQEIHVGPTPDLPAGGPLPSI